MLGVITSGYFILTYFILERKECFRKRKKRINLLKLKSTIKFYTEFGRANSNRFALHYLIRKELDNNNKVEVWMTTSPKAPGKISGLYSIDDGLVAAYMEMEEKCKSEYKKSENKFPDWNFKENNKKTPKEEMQKYADHIKEYSDSYDEDDDENEDED